MIRSDQGRKGRKQIFQIGGRRFISKRRRQEWVQANRATGTFELRRHYVRRFLDYIGACNVSDITAQKMEEFQTWAKKNCGNGSNAGNEVLRNLKVMFNWAMENEICTANIKRYPRLSYEPARTKQFTDEEVKKLIQKSDGEFRDMILFALLSGLRPQELRALQKQNLVQKDESYFLGSSGFSVGFFIERTRDRG